MPKGDDPIIPFRVSHALMIQRAYYLAALACVLVGSGMIMKAVGLPF